MGAKPTARQELEEACENQDLPFNRSRRGRPSRAQEQAITDRIVEAALRQFTTHGYGATSMKRIGDEAGVAPNTLYLRFSDKEALFRALIEWKVASWKVTNPPKRPKAGAGLEEVLEVAALGMLEAMAREDVAAIGTLLALEGERFPELARIYRESAMHVGRAYLIDGIRNAPDTDLAEEMVTDLATTLMETVIGYSANRKFYETSVAVTLRPAARRIAKVLGAGHVTRR